MKLKQLLTGLLLLILGLLCLPRSIFAQEVEQWTTPVQLSTQNTTAGEASLTVDNYGYVHAIWAEELENTHSIIQYARFDGQTWTKPTDFHITGELIPVNEINSFIDHHGILHVIWSQGFDQTLFYSQAPVEKAYSSINWKRPLRLNIQTLTFRLIVDSQDKFHMIYTAVGGNQGLFYSNSNDQGASWTKPLWLDPDLPLDMAPTSLSFAMDKEGGLHAVWSYKDMDENAGDWVRYVRSPDTGSTWSTPFTIAKNSEGDAPLNAFVRPNMALNGDEIHIIWAGGDLLYRLHRYSLDRGLTWSETKQDIFDGLNGQAGDGLAVDAAGRIHFFGQIRFPQGIYHSVWENNQWSPAILVYLMRITSTEDYGGSVLAHRTFPVIRAGNQLILTFTDEPANPERRLFAMYLNMDDVPALPPTGYSSEPPLTPESPSTPNVTQDAPSPNETPEAPIETQVPNVQGDTSPASFSNQPLLSGIEPVIVLIVIVLVARFLYSRRQS